MSGKSSSSISKTVLPNGIRVLSEWVPYVDSVSVGIWVRAGSSDESRNRRGISHFVEHMLFKGTEKRTARQIADEMDSLGGHLNAFTDKEFTCYYAKVLSEHWLKALDILADMVLNSVFDPCEIERERNVVMEEIKRHRDTPEEAVHDLMVQTLWRNHPLGNPVIGSAAVVKKLRRGDIVDYVKRFYTPDSIVVSAAGNVDHKELVDAVAASFGNLNGKRSKRSVKSVSPCFSEKYLDRATEQVHFCLGTKGYAQDCKEKYALAAIDAILGGGMSSRLFQEIRENRGLAYAIGSYSAAYKEAGVFAVYGGTSIENLQTVLELIYRECENIGKRSVTDEELARAKNQIRGALVLGQESMSNRMGRLAKSELYFGRIVLLDEVLANINDITRDSVTAVASELFNGSKFALAAIGPFGRGKRLKNTVGEL